jgi:hypothetical protein
MTQEGNGFGMDTEQQQIPPDPSAVVVQSVLTKEHANDVNLSDHNKAGLSAAADDAQSSTCDEKFNDLTLYSERSDASFWISNSESCRLSYRKP